MFSELSGYGKMGFPGAYTGLPHAYGSMLHPHDDMSLPGGLREP